MFAFIPFLKKYFKDKGYSKKEVYKLKVFQKVGDYNGNKQLPTERTGVEKEPSHCDPREALQAGMGSNGDGLTWSGFFLCT